MSPHVGLQSLFLALQLPSLEYFLQFKCSYSTLIAQTYPGAGGYDQHMDKPRNTWCSARVSLW